jgi:hypothetical protein
MTITAPQVKIPIILDMIYPEPWLAEKAENDPAGRTNHEVQFEVIRTSFCPLNTPLTDYDIPPDIPTTNRDHETTNTDGIDIPDGCGLNTQRFPCAPSRNILIST